MARTNDPLLRSFAGVLLGYVVLMSVSVLGVLAIRSAVGVEQLYEPGRFVPTTLFKALQITLAAIASLPAGYLCRRVAGSRRPAFAFAGIVFILSFCQALFAVTVPNANPPPRTGAETAEVIQAETVAQQPMWLTLLTPVVLVVGIVTGSWRRSLKAQS